jgi:hypothetical protein
MRGLWQRGKGDGLAVGKLKIFSLPTLFLAIAVMVLAFWVWPMKKNISEIKGRISAHKAELIKEKNLLMEIKDLRAFAQAHGDNLLIYLENKCFSVSSKEEIVPFLLDYLPGLGEGFYLFSWAPSHGAPKKVGSIGGIDVYRVPVSFGFNAYVVEAIGFVSSLANKRGIWVDNVEIVRKDNFFPAYKVMGGSCFAVEGSR